MCHTTVVKYRFKGSDRTYHQEMDPKTITESRTNLVDDQQTESSDYESDSERVPGPPVRNNARRQNWFSSACQRCSNFYMSITVEPVLLALMVCLGLQEGVTTNVYIERACLVVYNFTEDNCTGVLSDEINRIVHPYVADLIMFRSIAESVICASLSIFIGPWSDKNGRKPFIFLPVLGICLGLGMWLIFIKIPSIPPIYFLLTSVPPIIFGGFPALMTNAFCYMADITTNSNRAFRMTVMSLGISIGVFIGYGTTALISMYIGSKQYFLFYSLSFAVSLATVFYVGLVLTESVCFVEVEGSRFFSLTNVKEVMNSIYRRRTAKANCTLLMLILVSCINLVVMTGELSYRYLIGMENFSWSLTDYSIFALSLSAVGTLVQLPGLYVTTVWLKIKESHLSVIILLLTCYSSIVMTFSRSTFDFYLASFLGTFTGLMVPLIKSQITGIVQSSDTGKFFSFISILESICPLLASPLYNAWYTISLQNHHSIRLYFLSALLWGVAAMLFVGITFTELVSKGNSHERVTEDEERSEDIDNQPVTPDCLETT